MAFEPTALIQHVQLVTKNVPLLLPTDGRCAAALTVPFSPGHSETKFNKLCNPTAHKSYPEFDHVP